MTEEQHTQTREEKKTHSSCSPLGRVVSKTANKFAVCSFEHEHNRTQSAVTQHFVCAMCRPTQHVVRVGVVAFVCCRYVKRTAHCYSTTKYEHSTPTHGLPHGIAYSLRSNCGVFFFFCNITYLCRLWRVYHVADAIRWSGFEPFSATRTALPVWQTLYVSAYAQFGTRATATALISTAAYKSIRTRIRTELLQFNCQVAAVAAEAAERVSAMEPMRLGGCLNSISWHAHTTDEYLCNRVQWTTLT